IVRNVGKPRTFIGECDHQGTLGAGDEIDVGAGGTHGAVHAQPIADPGRPEDAWQRRTRADRMRDRNVARLRENEALAGVANRVFRPIPGVASSKINHLARVMRGCKSSGSVSVALSTSAAAGSWRHV